jgi:quinoprotein glucose dehydrogenase
MRLPVFCLLVFSGLFSACNRPNPDGEWSEYLGGPDRNHYTTLSQISPANVAQLKVAWTYSMPDSGQIQTNPIIVDGILYGITPSVQVFALDAATGRELWRFGDPLKTWHSTGRGVVYWTDGKEKRILHTIGPRLYALDAITGQLTSIDITLGHIDNWNCFRYRVLEAEVPLRNLLWNDS